MVLSSLGAYSLKVRNGSFGFRHRKRETELFNLWSEVLRKTRIKRYSDHSHAIREQPSCHLVYSC